MIVSAGVARFCERHPVSRETLDELTAFAEMVGRENQQQNLVGSSTLGDFWERHVLDSAQLVALAPPSGVTWLDVGSGAGLPGIVTAILTRAPHVLIEPRRRRADFLGMAVDALGLSAHVCVTCTKIEKFVFDTPALVVARAFASLTRTLAATFHLGAGDTRWLLHKGRGAAEEIAEARHSWSGKFEQIASVTAPDAAIVRVTDLAQTVRP